MSTIKNFTDQNGNVLAHGAITGSYMTGASLVGNGFQHESVPFFITAHAIDAGRNIMIFGLSDEKYTTYKNKMVESALKMMEDVRWNSIRSFIEPEDYLYQFAKAMSQMELTAVGEAALPSLCGNNQDQTYQDFVSFYNAAFQRDAAMGTETRANNILVRSFMRRYEGIAKSGVKCTVVAGMDYNGIEYYSPASALAAINPFAGLIGAAIRNKKAENSSKKLGQGEPCDAIDWGARNKFLLVTPKEYEKEAFVDFMEFVETFHMDNQLRQRFYAMNEQRVQMRMQETMRFQGMAQASMQSLMYNQQRLTQTLAQNSAAMSDMIMDSWDKKMASDSRISQARSEAIRGVNVYQNSYGQNVDVSVTADHVYENRYGDVYGVSGNAPDQELLNRMDWRELKK
ncbi:MAG: hypothetical protein IIZ95_07200 [Erysipelotrichaceae bacterium]|nr:hypothetical protein [Erysipelotrichaceae bacterium]MBQ2232677.1 hypothetical protein [Erysipelotrichaceae bacterium]MEE3425475.1 hypothetical protein [Erysipelotrichaceae bacterium]